jgi:integrase
VPTFRKNRRSSLEVARAIAAASRTFDRPDTPAWLTPPQYWRIQLAEYFYTGLRSGTVLRLQCKHFVDHGPVPMLDVPGDIVFKTSKAVQVAVHPQLATILRRGDAGPRSGCETDFAGGLQLQPFARPARQAAARPA